MGFFFYISCHLDYAEYVDILLEGVEKVAVLNLQYL